MLGRLVGLEHLSERDGYNAMAPLEIRIKSGKKKKRQIDNQSIYGHTSPSIAESLVEKVSFCRPSWCRLLRKRFGRG